MTDRATARCVETGELSNCVGITVALVWPPAWKPDKAVHAMMIYLYVS